MKIQIKEIKIQKQNKTTVNKMNKIVNKVDFLVVG